MDKIYKISFLEEKIFQGKFMAKFSIFFNIPKPGFQNSFVPIF